MLEIKCRLTSKGDKRHNDKLAQISYTQGNFDVNRKDPCYVKVKGFTTCSKNFCLSCLKISSLQQKLFNMILTTVGC